MLYIHIPFCKQRCIYCDFYSTIYSENKVGKYFEAVCSELRLRATESHHTLSSIYVGGGTPSVVPTKYLELLLNTIRQYYEISQDAEITIELNPDDVSPNYASTLLTLGVNRVSLGVQTFSDQQLKFLNRRHTSNKAIEAVQTLHDAGIHNLSIDLIYGLPHQTLSQWQSDVKIALSLPIKHLSAYSLMYESETRLTQMLRRGEITEVSEDVSLEMFKYLCDTLMEAGFEHYEISNFCKPGFHSKHNSGYWSNKRYIGIGAGAHSYDGTTRYYHLNNIDHYIATNGCAERIIEELTELERYNEYIFTHLRTKRGVNLNELKCLFGTKIYEEFVKQIQTHLVRNLLTLKNDNISLSQSGIFVSDDIMSDLMIVD